MQSKSKQLFFLIFDIFCFYLALFVSLAIRLRGNFTAYIYLLHAAPFTTIVIFWVLIFYIAGLYDLKNLSKKFLHFKLFISAILLSSVFSVMYFYTVKVPSITPKTILVLFGISFAIIDFILRQYLLKSFISAQPILNILILGRGNNVKELVGFLGENPQLGFKIKIHIEAFNENEIEGLIKNNNIDTMLVTSEFRRDKNLSQHIYKQMLLGVDVLSFAEFYENVFGKIPLDALEESWFLEKIIPKNGFYLFVKRLADIILSLALFVVLIVLFPIIVLLIKLSSWGSVIFSQERVGLREKVITIYKFRTMRSLKNTEAKDSLFEGNELNLGSSQNLSRVFWFGKFLRKTRLDELPQIINVLKGELSFIGPRVEYINLHNHLNKEISYYQIGTIIKPGLTGWAQIHGKNSNTIKDAKERLAYDIYYIKNRSLALDLIIALKTLKTIFTFSGV